MWKLSPAACVPTAFLVITNFHSFFYNSIEIQKMYTHVLFFSQFSFAMVTDYQVYLINLSTFFLYSFLDAGPCLPNPCENNGTCGEINSKFSCNCTPEFEGERCESGTKSILNSRKFGKHERIEKIKNTAWPAKYTHKHKIQTIHTHCESCEFLTHVYFLYALRSPKLET